MGDFNMDGSTETAYQTLVASGNGQAIDPLNTSDVAQTWGSATVAILTESAKTLDYRDDIQFMNSGVYNGTASAALRYVPGSYRAFGNNGTTAYGKSVNQTSTHRAGQPDRCDHPFAGAIGADDRQRPFAPRRGLHGRHALQHLAAPAFHVGRSRGCGGERRHG